MDQSNKNIDVICIGRVGVDLYALEEGLDLHQVQTFQKSVGGTPANIAVGVARLGGRAGLISKISSDSFGRYLEQFLQENNCDISMVKKDPERLNSLVFTEMKPDGCQVLFYRDNPADLNLQLEDISPEYIAQCRYLVISGTSLPESSSRSAILSSIQYARKAKCKIVFDLDYRPSCWQDPYDASLYYQHIAEKSDILVGNIEEFQILGYSADFHPDSLVKHWQGKVEILIEKKGSMGSTVHWHDQVIETPAFPCYVKKPFGAGDAYLSCFLHYLCQWGPECLAEIATRASASAAIVIGERTCAEAMPSEMAIEQFLQKHLVS